MDLDVFQKIRNSGQELHMLYGREEKAKSNLSFPLFRIGTDSVSYTHLFIKVLFSRDKGKPFAAGYQEVGIVQ